MGLVALWALFLIPVLLVTGLGIGLAVLVGKAIALRDRRSPVYPSTEPMRAAPPPPNARQKECTCA